LANKAKQWTRKLLAALAKKGDTVSILEPKDVFELLDPSEFLIKESMIAGKNGIIVVPESYEEMDDPVVKAGTGDFIKWLNHESPNIETHNEEERTKLVLRSGDYWLPLVYLANDISLPIYLNLVASYLYDKARGVLKGDATRVHLSAVYEDKNAGKMKQFNFEGDIESLQKAIKRFDLNKFLDD